MKKIPSREEIREFQKLLNEYRYDYITLAYLIFGFGEKGSDCENYKPYDWQIKEWAALSAHMKNPLTRDKVYKFACSSGNGAAKTSWGAMTVLMLMYTQRVRGRVTANTSIQMAQVVWPEYDIWYKRARYSDVFFEKFGTSIKARDEKYGDTWRFDTFTWSEESPTAISGLHNKGGCVIYVFEEAPGIPQNIFSYSSGAFTETDTMKLHLAFGNSDDPESKFEQIMSGEDGSDWRTLRIDTRTLSHVSQDFVADRLRECGGDEDHDDFRVRVRGLPRKSSADSIIRRENVEAALERREGFEPRTVSMLPCIIGVDPAWRGGDETVIWYRQGNYTKMLSKYRLEKEASDTHMKTYLEICKWEKELRADAVFIDQAEGTGIYTLAQNAGKIHWQLIAFGSKPTDKFDHRESEYHNIRAMMYYEANKWLLGGGIIDAAKEEWIEDIKKQLCWAKSKENKVTGKKLAESKTDIKERVGRSPDVADSFVLCGAYKVTERLPENDGVLGEMDRMIGGEAFRMPDHPTGDELYDDIESDLYR